MVFGQGSLLQKIFLPGFADAGADTSFQTSLPLHNNEDNDKEEEEEPLIESMQRFAPNVWIVEGPVVSFFGVPFPTRMVAIQLSDGSAWIWSPIALTETLASQIIKFVGTVKYIVSPNYLHWLFLKEWQDRFPEAKVFAPPGLEKRQIVKNIEFHATLTNETHFDFSTDIEHVIFEGGAMDEVVFFHKPSQTVIFCDLIQRHYEDDQIGWQGWLMRADGVVGSMGGTPKEWSFLFWINGLLPKARKSLDVILKDWKPEGMIIAHGEMAPVGACVIIENCLSWIPKEPKPCLCCPSNSLQENEWNVANG